MAVSHQHAPSGFGALLRQHRTAAGLSQEALAERAGLSARAVSDIERGVKTRPHPATMRALADALELSGEDRAVLASSSRPRHAKPAVAPPPDGLPVPVSPIIGRASELAMTIELIRGGTTRLLTVTGPGGVGKTRLSLEIARALAADYPDGTAFIELGPVTDPSLVISTVAAALKLRETGDLPLAATVREHLRQRRMLLVLDNCEHLLDAARMLAADLLATSPGVTLIATSRPPLRARGEHLLPLTPLQVPGPGEPRDVQELADIPSVSLFVQRASAVRPDFALTPGNVHDVAEICDRLDGLPLAIELAAIRMRTLSPSALARLLDERLRLLSAGPEDAPERHRTLRAAIGWSHDLLSPDHQSLFRTLAVFAGGCTLETAAEVATDGDPFTALDGVEALVDQGLLYRSETPDGDLRFGMLETVREFALERLDDAGDTEGARRSHAEAMAVLARECGSMLDGPNPGTWLARMEREQDNFRTALSWALGERHATGDPTLGLRLAAALWPFWHMHGHLQEGHAWLERAIDRGASVDPAMRADAFIMLANIANNLEDHPRAEALYSQGLQLYRELGNRQGTASALVGLGMVATNRGDGATAATLLKEALEICQSAGADGALVPCVYALGRLGIATGNLNEAERRFVEARQHCPPGAVGLLAYLTLEVAQLDRYRGNMPSARQAAEECLARFREIGERRAEAATLTELGHLDLLAGDLDSAIRRFREAADIHRELHDALGLARALEGIAAHAASTGDAALAARLCGATASWREQSGTVATVPEREALTGIIDSARARLGNDCFQAMWGEGSATSLDDALQAVS